jgi:hypothetical protein
MHRPTPIRLLALIGLVLGFAAPCWAWGPEGHRIVAYIATARLTPQARDAVKSLLGDATMADIASWPDEIRKDRPESGPWHYVDIPVDAAAYDATRDGRNGDNVIDAIGRFSKILADPSAPKQQRVEALKFVVHFLGDIHQPLHCAERNHDKGGNGRLVFFLDQPKAVNLHAVWDGTILRYAKGNTSDKVYAGGLDARISAAQAQDWVKGTPEDWANESHALAVSIAYKDVPADGPPPKLTQEYVDRARPVVDQQLSKAGVRLADLLNRVFSGPATAPAGGQ